MGQPQFPPLPKAATLADLDVCLQHLGKRPLKLIAEAVQPAVNESLWRDTLWTFAAAGDAITDKKLLPFPADSFQFSIANEHSKQDFHLHAGVLEIYASHSRMELLFENGAVEENLDVPSGVVIVPPGVPHQVKLHGITFVFQVAVNGGSVHDDRVSVPRRGPAEVRG